MLYFFTQNAENCLLNNKNSYNFNNLFVPDKSFNMQFKKYTLLITILLTLFAGKTFSQTDTLFWFAVPWGTSRHNPPQEANLTITATDPDDITTVTITQPYNGTLDTIIVEIDPSVSLTWDTLFNTITLLNVMNMTYVENPLDPSPYISNSAIKIQADREITAYYEYHRERNNPDIYSLKGTNGIGYDFWIPFQDDWNNHDWDGTDYAFSQIVIVATQDNTELTIEFPNGAYGLLPGTYTFNLAEAGMTLMFVPVSNPGDGGDPSILAGDRLKGVHIESTEPIAVTVGDDSVQKGSAYDFVGDQLVPVKNMFLKPTIGYEYIVMRGEVSNSSGNEKVYVLTTQNNTSISYQIQGQAMVNLPATALAGSQEEIDLIPPNQEFVYITADKPIYVWHVSGFGHEIGGAIVPTIDGCTGSLDVSFVRSKDDPFYLNIMTHENARTEFEISIDGGAFAPFLDISDFDPVGVSDFYVLKDGSSQFSDVEIPESVPIRIKNNVDVFHLGTINGVTSGGGCAYGYFSDFKENRGSVNIVQSGTDIITTCYGNEVELKASGGLTYEWHPGEFLDDSTIAEPSAFLPVGIHNFEVDISRPCFADTTLYVIAEIYENTEAYFTLSENIGCAPLELEIENLTMNADTFLIDWQGNNSYDFYADTNMSTTYYHTYTNNTSTDSIYTMKLYAYDKKKDCPDIYEKKIRVFPYIDADFSPDVTIGCNPLDVLFTDLSSSPTSDNYKWTFDDGESSNTVGDVSHQFKHFDTTDTVDYVVQLVTTSPYFCRDTALDTISVFSYLEGEFTIDTAFGCSPLQVQFTNNSAGEDTIYLDFGDGNDTIVTTFNTIDYTYINNSNVIDTNVVTLLAKNDEGCLKYWYDTIIVYPRIVADFAIDRDDGCNSQLINFTNNTNAAATKFLWTFGDGTNSSTTDASFTKTYTNNTNADKVYDFILYAESDYGCYDDTTDQITIYRAYANFLVDTVEGCSPLTVNITNTSIGNDITVWDWDYGDGNTDNIQSPGSHTYNNTTGSTQNRTMQLTVTGTGGCSTSKSVSIDVYSSIDVTFTPITTTICDSVDVSFNSTINPVIAGTTYEWNFGDGTSSSLEDPVKNYRNTGNAGQITYNPEVFVETPEGCLDSFLGTVNINPYVHAGFSIDKTTGCSPLTVTVTPVNYPGINEYRWDFDGDGTVDVTAAGASSQSYTYPANTSGADVTYDIELEVLDPSGTCTDTETKTVTVYSEVKADFDPQGSSDCNPYTVVFDNLSQNASTYMWDFDDGTTSSQFEPTQTFSHTAALTSIFNVNLKATSNRGCTHDTTAMVSVYPYVHAEFDIDSAEGCSPLVVDIINNSDGTIFRWYWNSSDGSGAEDYTSANATENFSHTYINNSGSDQTVYLTLIAENANGCSDTLTKAITVHTSVTAEFVSLSGSADCNQFTVDFDNQTDPTTDAEFFSWNFGDGTDGTSTKASPDIQHTFSNLTSSDVTYTVTLEASSQYGCTHDTTRDITVYRYVEADFDIGSSAGCSPLTVNISNNSSGTNFRWYWNSTDGSGAEDYTSANASENFSHTYINNSGTDEVVYLTLIAENANGCSDTLTKAITVHSALTAEFVSLSGPADCNQFTVDFDNQTDPASDAEFFSWDFGDGIDGTSTKASPDIQHTFKNITNSDVTYTVTLEAKSQYGCTHDTTLDITVYRYVEADFDIDSAAGCSPLKVNIANNSSGTNFRWYWNSVDGSGAEDYTSGNASENFSHTYINNSGTDEVVYLTVIAENANGCSDTLTRTITVHSALKAEFASLSGQADCNPFTVDFDNQTDPASDAEYFSWDFGDGLFGTSTKASPDIQHKFTNITSSDVTYTVNLEAGSQYGCTHDTTLDITVYRFVEADFEVDVSNGCSPLTVNVANNSSGTNFRWFWDDEDLSTADSTFAVNNSFSKTYYNSTGSDSIAYMTLIVDNGNGCYDTLKRKITIYSSIIAQFTTDVTEGCNPLPVNYTNTTNFASSYKWYFGDGGSSSAVSPNHTFENNIPSDTVFTTMMVATSSRGCKDTTQLDITTYSYVRAEFSMEDNEGCPPFTTTFDNISQGNSANTYEWQIDNNAVAGSPTDKSDFNYTFNNTNPTLLDQEIILIATNPHGCVSQYSDYIRVYQEVTAVFDTDDGVVEGCSPFTVTFDDQSIVPPKTIYSWDFDDGATSGSEEPTHSFFNPSRTTDTIFTVQLVVSSEYFCKDTTDLTLTVNHQPKANFTIDNTASCPPLVTNLQSTSIGEDSFEWRFGDGTTNNTDGSLSHSYPNTTNSVVQYTLELYNETVNGCKDSTSLIVNVFPEVTADFTYDVEGCSPFVSSFNSNISQNAGFFYWDFDDGSTSSQENPTHRFTNDSLVDVYYKVFLRASSEYDCWDTITQLVRVFAQPIAEFDVDPLLQRFPNADIILENKTNTGPWTYQWDFGDGNGSTQEDPGTHTYAHWGEYQISLDVISQTSPCNDLIIKDIEILPPVVNADFTSDINGGCVNLPDGLEVNFTAEASQYAENYTYEWDFGDGNTATGSTVSHVYTSNGTFKVQMTAYGEGGEDNAYKTIYVYGDPVAQFDAGPKVATMNQDLEARVEFFNLSECGDTTGCTYLWEFGDGETSTKENDVHNYTALGEYYVKLTVTTNNNCVDTASYYPIKVIGEGKIIFPNAFTPNTDGPTGGTYSETDQSNDVFHPVTQGVIEYELLIFNRWGELLFRSTDVNIGWDGYVDGKLAKQDVYVWKATGTFTNGQGFEKAGDVTLLR